MFIRINFEYETIRPKQNAREVSAVGVVERSRNYRNRMFSTRKLWSVRLRIASGKRHGCSKLQKKKILTFKTLGVFLHATPRRPINSENFVIAFLREVSFSFLLHRRTSIIDTDLIKTREPIQSASLVVFRFTYIYIYVLLIRVQMCVLVCMCV